MTTSARQRSAARLAAVQALYAIAVGEGTLDDILKALLDGRLGGWALADVPDPEGLFEPREEPQPLVPFDTDLLLRLVRGAVAERTELDETIDACLSGDWSPGRLETLVRAILRVGVFEMTRLDDIPPRVTVTEYVAIADAFYDGAEARLVNAVLDRVGREIHPDAFAAR